MCPQKPKESNALTNKKGSPHRLSGYGATIPIRQRGAPTGAFCADVSIVIGNFGGYGGTWVKAARCRTSQRSLLNTGSRSAQEAESAGFTSARPLSTQHRY